MIVGGISLEAAPTARQDDAETASIIVNGRKRLYEHGHRGGPAVLVSNSAFHPSRTARPSSSSAGSMRARNRAKSQTATPSARRRCEDSARTAWNIFVVTLRNSIAVIACHAVSTRDFIYRDPSGIAIAKHVFSGRESAVVSLARWRFSLGSTTHRPSCGSTLVNHDELRPST